MGAVKRAGGPRKKKPGSARHRRAPDGFALVVGTRIRSFRKELAFSFDAFVEETGLGCGYVSELERGLVVPSITALARIAAALELSPADLVLGESEREHLFAELRSAPPSLIQALRAQAAEALREPEGPDGDDSRL